MKTIYKLFYFMTALLILAMFLPAITIAQDDVTCESEVTVAEGDWLSTIAEDAYGDPTLYTGIAAATNLKAETDSTFATIDSSGKSNGISGDKSGTTNVSGNATIASRNGTNEATGASEGGSVATIGRKTLRAMRRACFQLKRQANCMVTGQSSQSKRLQKSTQRVRASRLAIQDTSTKLDQARHG